MSLPAPEKLDFDWAEKRWEDPLTGTEVICLSPDRKMHFRNNYHRYNMFTGDGRYAVFFGHEQIREGIDCRNRRIWARDMIGGEVRDLGPVPEIPQALMAYFRSNSGCAVQWAAARYSHRVNVLDPTDPDAWAFIQIDIDTGERRRIVPSKPISYIYDASFSADERWVYAQRKEKADLLKTMEPDAFRSLICAEPGHQEMVRIDLATGEVETVFENVRDGVAVNLEHPTPHPVDPDLFITSPHVIDLKTGQWIYRFDNTSDPRSHGLGHDHWALAGKRIYTHQWPSLNVHCLARIDLDTDQTRWFAGPPHTGFSQHVLIAPNEKFLVGDGYEFDRNTLPPDIRSRLEKRLADGTCDPTWCEFYLTDDLTNGGEIIWKYELPEESVLDDDKYWVDYDHMYTKYRQEQGRLLDADVLKHPEKTVKTTPVCKFRTMLRSHMLGYRLESNAHVTPDSRWVVFQSSSEDDFFQVWAARVPE